jgi:hypothetical protein
VLRIGPERATTIDDGDAVRLLLDHQPLDDAAAGKRADFARIKREHLLVAAESAAAAISS